MRLLPQGVAEIAMSLKASPASSSQVRETGPPFSSTFPLNPDILIHICKTHTWERTESNVLRWEKVTDSIQKLRVQNMVLHIRIGSHQVNRTVQSGWLSVPHLSRNRGEQNKTLVSQKRPRLLITHVHYVKIGMQNLIDFLMPPMSEGNAPYPLCTFYVTKSK